MLHFIKKLNKPLAIALLALALFFALSQTALGQRLNLPSWLYDNFQEFIRHNPDFSLAPYKAGTIILVKPIATGIGEGRYEAGDIVEIRDGFSPLGAEERTMLLPLYYPGKLTEEIKKKLMEPAYAVIARSDSDERSIIDDNRAAPSIIDPSPAARDDKKEAVADNKTMLRRRAFGVDYAKVLSSSEIIKARQFEKLDRLPEIDLSAVIDKKTGLALNFETNKKSAFRADSLEFRDDLINSALTSKSSIAYQKNLSSVLAKNQKAPQVARLFNTESSGVEPHSKKEFSRYQLGAATVRQYSPAVSANVLYQNEICAANKKQPQENLGIGFENSLSAVSQADTCYQYSSSENLVKGDFTPLLKGGQGWLTDSTPLIKGDRGIISVVHLPASVIAYESARDSIKNTLKSIAQAIIPTALAVNPAESVKVVDPGNGTGTDYASLNAWEAAQQADLTSTNVIAIAKCRSTGGAADTTAVTVDGWTTSATQYIKIWTDPTESFRHSGKWDTSKYRLEVGNNTVVTVNEENVRFDGLQIYLSSINDNSQAAFNIGATGSADLQFSNNIIKSVSNDSLATSYNWGIYLGPTGGTGTMEIWNNIIYGFRASTAIEKYAIAIGINCVGVSMYVYNNTLYQNNYGIYQNAGTVYAKNNIAYNNTDNYAGTFNAAGTNNLSGTSTDAQIPSSGARNGVNVLFADSANADYRLAEADTGAKGYGTSLASDANISFTTDIEGQPRGSTWDIGADQFAARQIYRSVGPSNTTALATGASNAMTISGATASFASGLPNNAGVGDVIQYATTTGATVNSLAFISGRSSPTSYTVYDAAGHIASSTSANTGWSLFRAYTSLFNAEAGTENTGINAGLVNFDAWSGGKNLASSTEAWNIAAYGDAVDTTAVTVGDWTTATSTYLRIYTPYLPSEVGVSQRHKGKWDMSKYRLEISGNYVSGIATGGYIKIEGLQIRLTNNNTNGGVGIVLGSSNSEVSASANIIKGVLTGTATYNYGIVLQATNQTSKIYNNIIYGFNNGNNTAVYDIASGVAYFYNNTIVNCYGGISGNVAGAVMLIKNNIVQSVTPSYTAYSGSSFDASSTNNLSSSAKVNFTSLASSTAPDLHLLASDVWARDNGADLSGDANLPFNTDIDGGPRPAGRAWDIGADEMAGATQANTPLSGKFKDSSLVGYWTFDGADMNWASSTAEALDRSGNNNNGNVIGFNNKSSVPGINGQALKFDGVDDYVSANNSLETLSSYTSCAWIRPNFSSSDTNRQTIVYRQQTNGDNNRSAGLRWAAVANKWDTDSKSAYQYTLDKSLTPFSAGQWHHLCFSMTGGSNSGQFYWDGVAKTTVLSSFFSYTPNNTANLPFYIGNEVASDYFNGSLDDVRIYNRALTAAEIAEQYRAGAAKMKTNTPVGSGATGLASGLVGYWSFDGKNTNWGTNKTNDLSGNGKIASMVNMSTTTSPAVGKIGQGLKFDGVNDYVLTPSVSFTTAFSVAFWLKTKAKGSGLVFGWSYNRNCLINYWVANKITCDDSGDISYSVSSSISINDGSWHHVVYAVNGDDQNLYVDGQYQSSLSHAQGGVSGVMVIGADSDGAVNLSGALDDFRIYNYALATSTIQQLYLSGGRKAKIKQ